MKEVIDLAKLKNETLKDFNILLIEKHTGIKPEVKPKNILYTDDDNCLNNYIYNKSYKQGVKDNITNISSTKDNIEMLRTKFGFKTLTD